MTSQASGLAYCGLYYAQAPQIEGPGLKTWVARGANFVVTVSAVSANARLSIFEHPDECMMYLPDVGAAIDSGSECVQAGERTLNILPPGASEVTARGNGQIVCIYSNRAAALLALADNAATYADAPSAVTPLVPWPEPLDGYRLRQYRIDDYVKDDSNMRIFRSSNLMINILMPRLVPRDVHNLSPHSHVDFEQGSLALRGTWMHHLRYPWTKDMTTWHDDMHLEVGSPSLLVVPPKVIHTSRNLNEGGSWLLDIFAPPRLDFASKPGLVCNSQDYPMPGPATVS